MEDGRLARPAGTPDLHYIARPPQSPQQLLPDLILATIGAMKITINGQEQTSEPITLAQLVESLGMKQDRVAVELNRDIVPRAQWAETNLAEGDRLEIVHFVGGGFS
jgi:sulfur carrier protein